MIILGIVVYLVIGGVATAIIDDDDIGPGIMLLWPIALFILTIVGLYTLFELVGRSIVTVIEQALQSIFGEEGN